MSQYSVRICYRFHFIEVLRAESNICEHDDDHSMRTHERSNDERLLTYRSPARLPFEMNEHIELPNHFDIECSSTPTICSPKIDARERVALKEEIEETTIVTNSIDDVSSIVVCEQASVASTSCQQQSIHNDDDDDTIVSRPIEHSERRDDETRHTNQNHHQSHLPLRMKIKLESLPKEKKKKNKKKRKWRHSSRSSSSSDRFDEQREQQTRSALKLRFRIAPNGVADVLPWHHHQHHSNNHHRRMPVVDVDNDVDHTSTLRKVPKLTLKLVANDRLSSTTTSSVIVPTTTTTGLEPSDSESDSVDDNLATNANNCHRHDDLFAYGHYPVDDDRFNNSGRNTVHFSSPSGKCAYISSCSYYTWFYRRRRQ